MKVSIAPSFHQRKLCGNDQKLDALLWCRKARGMTGKTIIPQDQATPARIWGEHRASCVAVKVFYID
jgi:hypothetical protein